MNVKKLTYQLFFCNLKVTDKFDTFCNLNDLLKLIEKSFSINLSNRLEFLKVGS